MRRRRDPPRDAPRERVREASTTARGVEIDRRHGTPGGPGDAEWVAMSIAGGNPVSNHGLARLLQRQGGQGGPAPQQPDPYGYDTAADPLTAEGFGPSGNGLSVRPSPVRRVLIEPRDAGAPIRESVEDLLTRFSTARGREQQSAIALQIVRSVIAAYGLATDGLDHMRFDPGLSDVDAKAFEIDDDGNSRIIFGPGAFGRGFAWVVHIVAHELEHVRQHRAGGVGSLAVAEFEAYTQSILGLGPAAAARGGLGGRRAAPRRVRVPVLGPELLYEQIKLALENWRKMSQKERASRRDLLADVRDRVLSRVAQDGPPGIRPPTRDPTDRAFKSWLTGKPPEFSSESEEETEAARGPWGRIKQIWKEIAAEVPF